MICIIIEEMGEMVVMGFGIELCVIVVVVLKDFEYILIVC